jgi:hypothetical protein
MAARSPKEEESSAAVRGTRETLSPSSTSTTGYTTIPDPSGNPRR